MKTQLRLNSTVPHGAGSGPESGGIDLIYSFLLTEFEQTRYKYICINQVGLDLKEFIMRESGNKIHVNIYYPSYEDFEIKTINEKNLIRLDIIHTALVRIAKLYGKLEIKKLETIKEKIIANKFDFDFVYKCYKYKGCENLTAKIIVHPEMDRFNYNCMVEKNNSLKCNIQIYSGLTNLYYYPDLFSYLKWKSENVIIITGKREEVELYIDIEKCTVIHKNLTNYSKPPYFEMMKADVSNIDREKVYKDWLHSLPPAQSALLGHIPN